MELNGEVGLKNASFNHKGMRPVLNGSIKLAPDKITLDGLKLIAGKSSADIKGYISNYSEYPDMQIDMKSSMLNLDEMIVPAAAKQKAQVSDTKKVVEEELGPMKIKLKAIGNVTIAKTLYKGIPINNFRAQYELKDNIFRINQLSGNTLSGGFTVKLFLDLNKKGTIYNINAPCWAGGQSP